jgi:predicted DNA-binding transcriptional regulator AlpA
MTETLASALLDRDALDLVDIRAVSILTGLSRAGIYRAVRVGTFPPPVKLSPKVSRWIKQEILAWRNARVAERKAVQP